jgi:two-component system, OmpR family, phosphate regulon sensor histidine kinase PhoR
MAQVARRIWQVVASIWVLIPLVIVAATALAYYSYRYAHEMAQRGERSIATSTRDLAEDKSKRVENLITDADGVLYKLVNLERLQEIRSGWEFVAPLTPTARNLIIVDSTYVIAPDGFYSKAPREEAEAFKKLFTQEILKDLHVERLQEGEEPTYLHREYGGRYRLLSYLRHDLVVTASDGTTKRRPYYIVIDEDLPYIQATVFEDVFQGVQERHLFRIVDEHDELVYGHPPFDHIPAKFQVEVGFQHTLSSWRLRMAAREAESLAAREGARRGVDFIFIILAAVIVFGGVSLLMFAVSTERRANRLKSDFIANVSHELKTPLSLIRMFAELLATGRTKGADSAREYAEIITRESERLSRLIDNVLDFARIEGGKAAYEFRMGDLAEVLSRGLDVYRYRLDREGMKLTVDIEPDLPPIRIDENAMTLVLLNLVDNAVKYAAEGKALAVSLRRDGERVLIDVTDRGPGIQEDERERIFERFYRTRHVRGRPVRGSGIGLSLVKHIAEAHHGGVTVSSAVGKGSTFTVWLPITKEEEPAPELAA